MNPSEKDSHLICHLWLADRSCQELCWEGFWSLPTSLWRVLLSITPQVIILCEPYVSWWTMDGKIMLWKVFLFDEVVQVVENQRGRRHLLWLSHITNLGMERVTDNGHLIRLSLCHFSLTVEARTTHSGLTKRTKPRRIFRWLPHNIPHVTKTHLLQYFLGVSS